jgi:hypothetical protein
MRRLLNLFSRTTKTPIAPAEVEALKATMKYVRTFVCGCGATLRIRARDARQDGPSNFRVYPPAHPRAGHSQVPAEFLNWAGLAEERGWKTSPDITCPACQAGVTMAQYKAAKREGRL